MRRRGVSAALALLVVAAAGLSSCSPTHERPRYPPLVVMSQFRLPGIVVRGARLDWWKAVQPARYGDPLPVGVTMYCLKGTTRRGRYVRAGIVAADPRFFPLAHYIELYVGRHYLGRFLVDDTGLRIRGPRIDVWTNPTVAQARRFGLQRGTAVLVPKPPSPMLRQASGAVSTTKPSR